MTDASAPRTTFVEARNRGPSERLYAYPQHWLAASFIRQQGLCEPQDESDDAPIIVPAWVYFTARAGAEHRAGLERLAMSSDVGSESAAILALERVRQDAELRAAVEAVIELCSRSATRATIAQTVRGLFTGFL